MELLGLSSISDRFKFIIKYSGFDGVQGRSRESNGGFHDISIDSFKTRRGSFGSFIEIEGFGVSSGQVTHRNEFHKVKRLCQGGIFNDIRGPSTDIKRLPEFSLFNAISAIVKEDRNNSGGSFSAQVVDLHFSEVFFISNEMFLGEFEFNSVGFEMHISKAGYMLEASEISLETNFVSIECSRGRGGGVVMEGNALIKDLFGGSLGKGNRGLVVSMFTFGGPVFLIVPVPVS